MAGEPCTAGFHGTHWAHAKYGCTCPAALEDSRRVWRTNRARVPRTGQQRPGRRKGEADPIAVERAIGGEALRLNEAEMLAAVVRMTRWGMSLREIAIRLRASTRTVGRYRRKARAAGLLPRHCPRPGVPTTHDGAATGEAA